MEKYVLFGAGNCALQAISLLGKENIIFIVDNDKRKSDNFVETVPIRYYEDVKEELAQYQIVISVSERYQGEVEQQLERDGLRACKKITEIQAEIIKEKILRRMDYVSIYQKAVHWVLKNTVFEEGIINNSSVLKPYPEVTGYFIPSLIRWGYRELAISYAKWLCKIQKEDGSWYDTEDVAPYIFDTAQILKGLLAVRDIYPYVDANILAGCDWLLSRMTKEGRLDAPVKEVWKNERECSECMHLYCISPLVEAAEIFHRSDYRVSAKKILDYYKNNYSETIKSFSILSHFYAYVMEGLLDLGEWELVSEGMEEVAKVQKESGAVPAYDDVDWICSTGLFQFALIWFRLGDLEKGRKAFTYACRLQNESGGWYGSYMSEENSKEINSYIPYAEISWTVKYFLDALYYKNVAEFQVKAPGFQDEIDKNDGRYRLVYAILDEKRKRKNLDVLDVGCGKGRFLKQLVNDIPDGNYHAVDLSEKVMQYCELENVEKKQGSLTNIPYSDKVFDVVYTCEALEHAIDIRSAVREMARVTKPGGTILVIDKNKDKLGKIDIEEWEQWFDENELKNIMSEYCSEVKVEKEIDYDDLKSNGLIYAWIGIRA